MLRGAIVSGLLWALGTAAASAACPDYPGQSHAEIVRGVEGRLDGDWRAAISNTERAAKRQRSKGQDPAMALLFVEVLKCLREEVRAGGYADVVAAAKADPRPARGSSSGPTRSETRQVETRSLTAPAQPAAPAPAAPSQQQAALVPPLPAEPPPLAPPPVVAALPAPGVAALPGTAESYGLAPAPAQSPLAPARGYVGQQCNYFTRPPEETVGGTIRYNRYGEGEWVCFQSTMYACAGGVWQDKGACKNFNRWETRTAEVLEARPR